MQSLLLELISKHWKKLAFLGLFLVALASSYYYGRQSVSPEVIEKEKIVEKVVEKIVKVTDEKTKQNTTKTTKVIEHPDGTKETVIEEKTQIDSEKNTNEVADKKSEVKKDTSTQTKSNNKSKYRVGVIASTSIPDFTNKNKNRQLLYTGTASMRVFGPFWLDGLYNFSHKEIGLGISLEF